MAEAVVKDGRVQLRDAQGGAFSIPEAEAAAQLATGEFRLESPEEFEQRSIRAERETLGQQALTVGEGAVRGATLGLGTAALAELGGDEYRQAALERQEINPGLAVGGELLGAVAPAFLTGGAGAAGTVARAAPASLVGRAGVAAEQLVGRALAPLGESLGATVARGAAKLGAAGLVEGAAYGLGSSLADSALEGTEWTAERALSGLESGALYGLAGGAALGGGQAAASRAMRRAGSAVVDGMFAAGKGFKTAVQDWAGELAESGIVGKGADDVADLLSRVTSGGAAPERAERMAAKIKAAGLETGSRGEVAALAKSEAAEALSRHTAAVEQLSVQGAKPNGAALRSAVSDAVDSLEASGSADHVAAAKRLRKLARTEPATLADAESLQRGIGDVITWARDSKKVAAPELERLSAKVSSQIDEAAAVAGPTAQATLRAAREEAADWGSLAKKLGREKLTDAEAGKMISVLGTAAGLATGSIIPYVGTAIAARNPAARQFVAERGGAAVAWLASRAAPVENTLRSAARRIAASEPVGILRAAVDARDASSRAKSRVELGARALGVSGTAEDRRKRFESARDAINAAANDPTVMTARIRQAIDPIAIDQPEVAQAMARRIIADHQYLASKMPATTTAMGQSLTPNATPPLVSKADQEKAMRYVSALANPIQTIEGIADGEINWEGVDALKERRPGLWADFGAQVALEAGKRETPLPYKQRVYLSLLFDIPTDPSMTPEGAAAIAEAAAYQPGATEPQGPGRGAPSSLDAKAIGGEMATPAQASGAMM